MVRFTRKSIKMRKTGLALLLIPLCIGCTNAKLRKENELLREELARQQQYVPLKRDTIRDTVEIVTQRVVTVEKIKEVLTADDRKLMKDLCVKVKELESLQKTGMVAHDTVFLAPWKNDSVLRYKDAWAEFEYWEKQRKLNYSVKDSLAIAVRREYKYRLLWWRWGIKGYEVKAVSFNPHTTIRYNSFVRRGE